MPIPKPFKIPIKELPIPNESGTPETCPPPFKHPIGEVHPNWRRTLGKLLSAETVDEREDVPACARALTCPAEAI